MRVLFSCVPQDGHLRPLLPLAGALAAQGADVLVATGANAADTVQAANLGFRETGPSFADWFDALRARTRGMPGDGLPPERVERYFLPRLFGEVGSALVVDDLMAAVVEHRSDVIVFDPVMFAAPLVAARHGVAAVQHLVGPLYDDSTLELVGDAVSPIWREFDLEVPPAAGMYAGTTVAICPPSLDPKSVGLARLERLRPTATPKPDVPPLPHRYPNPERPLVYVTLGTFSNTNLQLFRLIVDSLVDANVNLLITMGSDNDPAALGATAPNVHVARFIPQADLLPHCTTVVHHAGAGTSFGVLAHGLPSLALPQSADNFTIGERLATAGAAITVAPAQVSAEIIASSLKRLLHDPAFARSARKVAGEIAAMPTPDDVARRWLPRLDSNQKPAD